MILVHAGNRIDTPGRGDPRFPEERVAAVAARLGELLDVLTPDAVVSAAASGADLLLVGQAQRRGIAVHLVLPFDRRRFRAESVADQGSRWAEAFDDAVRAADADARSSVLELDHQPDDAGFRAGNQALLDHAMSLTSGVLAVAVRPRCAPAAASITDDFVDRAEAAGLLVLEIDPLRV